MELNEETKAIVKTYSIDIYDLLNDLITIDEAELEETKEAIINKLQETIYIVENIYI